MSILFNELLNIEAKCVRNGDKLREIYSTLASFVLGHEGLRFLEPVSQFCL